MALKSLAMISLVAAASLGFMLGNDLLAANSFLLVSVDEAGSIRGASCDEESSDTTYCSSCTPTIQAPITQSGANTYQHKQKACSSGASCFYPQRTCNDCTGTCF